MEKLNPKIQYAAEELAGIAGGNVRPDKNNTTVTESESMIIYRPNSTNIDTVEYFKYPAEHLNVLFTNGSTYVYLAVPESRMREFIAAPSAGSFFAQNIRNVFKCEKL